MNVSPRSCDRSGGSVYAEGGRRGSRSEDDPPRQLHRTLSERSGAWSWRALSSLSRPSLAVAGCVNSTTDLQEDAQMVTLTGNGGLTKDPELRHTSAGKAVATVSVAAGVPAERARAAQAARPGRVGLPCPSATAGLGHHGRPDAPGSTGPTIRLRAIQAPVREARYLTLTRCGRCSFSPSMTAAAGSRPPSRATSTRSPTV